MLASQLIDFIENNHFEANTVRFSCCIINMIRINLRYLYNELYEVDSQSHAAANLRFELLKLQSSPEYPSSDLLIDSNLDNARLVKKVYGEDIARKCYELNEMLTYLDGKEHALLNNVIEAAKKSLKSIQLDQVKIWCHRREKNIFLNKFLENGIKLNDENFIHSLNDYRNSNLFQILLKIGPLRSSGWGKVPNVILNSPKYITLHRSVWNGLPDEIGFDNDLLLPTGQYKRLFKFQELFIEVDRNFSLNDAKEVTANEPIEFFDDLEFLTQRAIPTKYVTPAVLIELANENGILCRPGSKHLVFNNKQISKLAFKQTVELEADDYLVFHNIETDFGNEQVELEKTTWAKIWKNELKVRYENNRDTLLVRMREAGISLLNLEGAISRWTKMEGRVITGPLLKRHFHLLIEKVLNDCLPDSAWRDAWREIKDSDVRAMQNGMLENDITNEQIVLDVTPHLDKIGDLANREVKFSFTLPEPSALSGTLNFVKVMDVSSNYSSPHEKLNIPQKLSQLEIYKNHRDQLICD